jgi:integrase/recombinase XerD
MTRDFVPVQKIDMRKKLAVDWNFVSCESDFDPTLKRFRLYLMDNGLRPSTIESYLDRVGRFLKFAKTERPPVSAFQEFREELIEKNLSKSTINNYSFAIRFYYRMQGETISFNFLQPNNNIPHYFDEDDILRILNSSRRNLKHNTLLSTIFYCCLRASELCNLSDQDIDLKSCTLKIREGKGGRDGVAYINEELAVLLTRYLQIRPPLEIDGEQPLFYTDYGQRWDRKDLYRLFMTYKALAGVKKSGGLHVFSRHSPASILAKNGCDITSLQEIMRHRQITTTARYLHISETVRRDQHRRCLVL